MSLAIANTDKLCMLRQDALRLGLAVLPPDVNRSGADFTVEKQADGSVAIRYALGAVKRVGLAAMAQLVAARGGRPFKDLADFTLRVEASAISRGQIEILAKAGAFDGIVPNRAQVFTAAEAIVRLTQSHAEERLSGQIGLFGGGAPEPVRLSKLEDWPQLERLNFEVESIGFHISAHPLDMYAAALKRIGVVASSGIERRAQAGGTRLKLAGTVSAKKERITRTGSRMMWLTLTDGEGAFEVTLFSEVLNRVRDLLADGTALLVTADAKIEAEALRLTATDVVLLEKAAAEAGGSMRVWLDRSEALPQIRALLDREGRGRGRITLVPKTGLTRDLDIVLPGGFNVSPRLAQAMKMVPGVERIESL